MRHNHMLQTVAIIRYVAYLMNWSVLREFGRLLRRSSWRHLYLGRGNGIQGGLSASLDGYVWTVLNWRVQVEKFALEFFTKILSLIYIVVGGEFKEGELKLQYDMNEMVGSSWPTCLTMSILVAGY